MRARGIKPGFFQNENLGKLDPLTRILFIGLWCLADRRGRLEDRPERIKASLFPYDECDANTMLASLEHGAEQFIIRYMIGNKKYIQIINFHKHQYPHVKEQESVIPPPDGYDANGKETSTMQTPDMHSTCPSDSPFPITDSPFPITEEKHIDKRSNALQNRLDEIVRGLHAIKGIDQ